MRRTEGRCANLNHQERKEEKKKLKKHTNILSTFKMSAEVPAVDGLTLDEEMLNIELEFTDPTGTRIGRCTWWIACLCFYSTWLCI